MSVSAGGDQDNVPVSELIDGKSHKIFRAIADGVTRLLEIAYER